MTETSDAAAATTAAGSSPGDSGGGDSGGGDSGGGDSGGHSLDLGRYKLGRILGVGGFATVYEAIDERFESPVAVKVLAENHAMNIDVRERFLSEAQLQRRLSGAGVVAVHDLGETARRQPYTVMALADGGDLKERVTRLRNMGVRPTETDALEVAEALARSVAALHSRGIVHRDLKPSNLLIFSGTRPTSATTTGSSGSGAGGSVPGAGSGVGADGDADHVLAPSEFLLLGDLGFAKELSSVSGLTVAGGTPGFRPPEQERVGQVDYRADVFGASAVLYWLLTGRWASSRDDEDHTHLTDIGINKEFAAVLAQGLEAEPDDRQDTIVEWIEQLRSAHRARGLRNIGVRKRSRARRSWKRTLATVLFSILVVAGALGLGGWAGWRAYQRFAPQPEAETTLTTETLPNGQVLRRGTLGEMTVTIIGPDELDVGETVEFVASVSGAESFYWVGPDGRTYEGRQLFAITGTRSGAARVSVGAARSDGTVLTVYAEVVVDDRDDGVGGQDGGDNASDPPNTDDG